MASCFSNILGCASLQTVKFCIIQINLGSNCIMNAVVIIKLCILLLYHCSSICTYAHMYYPKANSNWELCFLDLLLLTSFSLLFMLFFSPLFSQAVCVCRKQWHVTACSPSPTGMQKSGRKRVHMQTERGFKNLKGRNQRIGQRQADEQ